MRTQKETIKVRLRRKPGGEEIGEVRAQRLRNQ